MAKRAPLTDLTSFCCLQSFDEILYQWSVKRTWFWHFRDSFLKTFSLILRHAHDRLSFPWVSLNSIRTAKTADLKARVCSCWQKYVEKRRLLTSRVRHFAYWLTWRGVRTYRRTVAWRCHNPNQNFSHGWGTIFSYARCFARAFATIVAYFYIDFSSSLVLDLPLTRPTWRPNLPRFDLSRVNKLPPASRIAF